MGYGLTRLSGRIVGEELVGGELGDLDHLGFPAEAVPSVQGISWEGAVSLGRGSDRDVAFYHLRY